MGRGVAIWMAVGVAAGAAAPAHAQTPCPRTPPSSWSNCLGVVTNPDGSRYAGAFRGGAYDGEGVLAFANGESYVGGFRFGLWNGQGVYSYANGDRYEGSFANGQWEGQGTYVYANGERWVGAFHNGARAVGALYDSKGVLKSATAPVAAEPDVERVDIVDSGLFETTLQRKIDAPKTASGDQLEVAGVRLVEASHKVPARLGVEFGLHYRPVGKTGAVVEVRKLTRFPAPGLANPATGKTLAVDEFDAPHRVGDVAYTGYRIANAWEIRPGTWTIELWVGERKLAAESFEVGGP